MTAARQFPHHSRSLGELPGTPVLPEALTAGEFELEGQVLRAVSVGQGDTEFSTVLHVPVPLQN